MIWLILISDTVGGILDALGGYHWLFARRYIMPFVFGVVVSIITHIWWLGVLVWPAMGTLTLPYSGKEPHVWMGTWWWRGIWLSIQALALSIGLVIFHHLAFGVSILYIILAGGLGSIYKDWKQTVGDFVTGAYLGTILFFVG